jgi:hypothetical protein
MNDNRNFYITWQGHPRYKEDQILVEDPILNVIQKIELVLFTEKGSYIGDLDLGADLTFYIWNTTVSAEYIRSMIMQQFDKYIPELKAMNYTLNTYIMEGELMDILVVDITIEEYGLKAIFQ